MKPHIVKRWGLWYCGLPSEHSPAVGYTPAMAYAEWKAKR